MSGWREVCRWDEEATQKFTDASELVGILPERRWVTPDEGLGQIIAMPLDDDTVLAIHPDAWETRYRELHKITKRLLETLDEYRTEQDGLVDTISDHAGYQMNACRLIDSLIACYEELAGEHRELTSQHKQAIEVLNALRVPDPAQVPEGQVSVRPYVRAKPRRSRPVEIGADHPTVQAAPGEGHSGASGEDTGLVQIVGTCEIHGPPSVVGEVCYPDAIPAQPEERSE